MRSIRFFLIVAGLLGVAGCLFEPDEIYIKTCGDHSGSVGGAGGEGGANSMGGAGGEGGMAMGGGGAGPRPGICPNK